jgi:hypothetical protein
VLGRGPTTREGVREGTTVKTIVAVAGIVLVGARTSGVAQEPHEIGFASVASALQALRDDPSADFRTQQDWTLVATRELDKPVQWFFTPEGHPAHPSVVKRSISERDGVGYIDVAALCHVPQSECDRLLEDFRQLHLEVARSALAQQVLLDIGIETNAHERVRVKRLLTEEGKAAEIRMDEVFKVVIVPTLDEAGAVTLWTAMYEFDGDDFVLMSEPAFATPGAGTADIEFSSGESGNTFRFMITPLVASR